jgi:hypothetical protein
MAIENVPDEVNAFVRYALSLYIVIMCCLAVLVELEWFSFIMNSRLLTNWISRGFAYIFIALLSIDQAMLGITTKQRELEFIIVVSYMLGVIGAGYIVMGVFCMQICLKRLREEHEIRTKGGRLKKRDAARNGDIIPIPFEDDPDMIL